MHRTTLACLVVLLAVTARPAGAQDRGTQDRGAQPNRPYRGLFGAPPADSGQRLTFGFRLGGGYDNNVLVSDLAVGSSQAKLLKGSSSVTSNASMTLDYSRQGDLMTLSAAATTSSNYIPALDRPFSYRHNASVNAFFDISPRTRFNVGQQVSYEPYYSFAAVAATGTPTGTPTVATTPAFTPGTNALVSSRITLVSNLSFSREITRRMGVSLYGGYQRSGSGLSNLGLSSYQAGGRVNYAIGRGLSVRVGYSFSEAQFGSGSAGRYRTHNADIDFGFGRALSLGRSTTLAFGTGIAALRGQDSTRYRLRGNVSLLREIGRTWTAAAVYSRNIQYLDILRAPALADAVTFSLGGFVSRRVGLNFGAGLSTGEVGAGQGAFTADRFHTYYGATSLTFGIARNVGLSTSYSYFRYRAGDNIVLPAGLPRQTDRQGIRLALVVSPLFSWTRR